MSGEIKRGLLAGAAGTALLNATTYLDMALRGRPQSDTPGQTVDAFLAKLGRRLPGSESEQKSRRTGLGAVSGTAAGLGIGMAASFAQDASPRPSAGLIFRSLSLGLATGIRCSLGFAAPGLLRAHHSKPAATAGRALAVGGELVADKLPRTPSRLQPPSLTARLAVGAGGARALAHTAGAAPALPVLAGVAGAALGSYGGAGWRHWAGARRPDWQGALVEDGIGLALAFASCRGG